jgi:hypothetical protein
MGIYNLLKFEMATECCSVDRGVLPVPSILGCQLDNQRGTLGTAHLPLIGCVITHPHTTIVDAVALSLFQESDANASHNWMVGIF